MCSILQVAQSCNDVEQQAGPAKLCVKRRHKESWADSIPSCCFVKVPDMGFEMGRTGCTGSR